MSRRMHSTNFANKKTIKLESVERKIPKKLSTGQGNIPNVKYVERRGIYNLVKESK